MCGRSQGQKGEPRLNGWLFFNYFLIIFVDYFDVFFECNAELCASNLFLKKCI